MPDIAKKTATRAALASCLILLGLLLAGCATSNFYPHEGRDNNFQGRGGSRFVSEGIDIWFIGEPDRHYRILGYIEEPMGAIIDEQHRSIASSVLKKAHEVGADALIETPIQTVQEANFGSGVMFSGHRGATSLGLGYGIPAPTRQQARYTAIKYLD